MSVSKWELLSLQTIIFPKLNVSSSTVGSWQQSCFIPDVDFMAHNKFFDLQLALPFQCLRLLIQGLISLLNNSVFPLLSVIHRRHFCLKGENVALQFPSVFFVLFCFFQKTKALKDTWIIYASIFVEGTISIYSLYSDPLPLVQPYCLYFSFHYCSQVEITSNCGSHFSSIV